MPDGPDLEHHHADRMGDDVVQLARDPRSLLCHRDTCSRLALALGLRRAHLGRLGLLGALAQRVAREPADPELERNEDELAGRSARGCCRRRPLHCRERSARPIRACRASRRFPSRNAAAIPTTKRLSMNGISCRVDERDRRREQPVRRRAGEGKAPAREEREHQDRDRRVRRTTATWAARPAYRR